MAIQLSAYLALRNDNFRNMLDGPSSRLNGSDKPKLRAILEELDRLHQASDMVADDSIVYGPNPDAPLAVIPVERRVLERSLDRKRSGELFLQIHHVLRGNYVDSQVYARLQKAHEELHITAEDADFKRALEYGAGLAQERSNWLTRTGRISGSRLKDAFCWEFESKAERPSFYRRT